MPKKESYAIIEQLNGFFRLVNLRVNEAKSLISVERETVFNDFSRLRKPILSADKAVLAFSSEISATIESVISIRRSNPLENINRGELDYLVFKVLWEFLNLYRNWVSRKLRVADIDIILADVNILYIYIDSRRVLNPLECKGKVFSARVKGTFIPRDILSLVSQASKFGKKLSVVERLSTTSSFIGKGDFAVNVGLERTDVFSLKKDEIKFEKKYEWGLNRLVRLASIILSVDDIAAEEILLRYFKGNVSNNLKNFLDLKMKKEFEKLERIAKDFAGCRRAQVYVNVPEFVFNKCLKNLHGVSEVNLLKLLEEKGFNVMIKKEKKCLLDSGREYLAIAAHPPFAVHYDLPNKMLKRRSKWLIPFK